MLKVNPYGEVQEISIFELMDGAVQERAALVMRDILDNIADPNTDAKKVRALTVKFLFHPSGDREEVDVDMQCESRLAPIRGIATRLALATQEGVPVAVEHSKVLPGQLNLSGDEQPADKIIALTKHA